jgi:hypothetical protein
MGERNVKLTAIQSKITHYFPKNLVLLPENIQIGILKTIPPFRNQHKKWSNIPVGFEIKIYHQHPMRHG